MIPRELILKEHFSKEYRCSQLENPLKILMYESKLSASSSSDFKSAGHNQLIEISFEDEPGKKLFNENINSHSRIVDLSISKLDLAYGAELCES